MVVVRYKKTGEYGRGESCQSLPEGTVLFGTDVRDSLFRGDISEIVCNRLIKKSYIDANQIFFHEGIIFEDDLWSFQAAVFAKSLYVVDRIIYNYTLHKGSVMTSTSYKKRIDSCRTVLLHIFHCADEYHLLNSIFCHDRIKRYRIRLFKMLVADRISFRNEYVSLHELVHYSWYDCFMMNRMHLINQVRDFHLAFPVSICVVCYYLYIKSKVLIG